MAFAVLLWLLLSAAGVASTRELSNTRVAAGSRTRLQAMQASPAHEKLNAALDAAVGRVPTWWECKTCKLCTFATAADAVAPPAAQWGSAGACPLCTGCTHHLEVLSMQAQLPNNLSFEVRNGSTGAALFVATDAAGTERLLKLHGVASPMVSQTKLALQRHMYARRHILRREVSLARFLSPLAAECGLGHVSVTEEVAHVRAVIPGTAELLEERHAVLSERARGINLEDLTNKLQPEALLALMARVPHDAVRDAALFDLLFLQGDRHSENVFIDADGALKLIDTRDAALDDALNSIFFPSTFIFQRNRVGEVHLRDRSTAVVTHHWPQCLLDFRCHVPRGVISTSFPPKLRACLTEWTAMSPAAFQAAKFPVTFEERAPVMRAAERLHAQARGLLQHGFEGLLVATPHRNSSRIVPHTFGFVADDPCCEMALHRTADGSPGYECTQRGRQLLPET